MKNLAILIFDDAEVLDFCGPFEVFSVANELSDGQLFSVYTVSEHDRPVRAKNGLRVLPDYDFRSCPTPDILLMVADEVVVFDNLTHTATIAAKDPGDVERAEHDLCHIAPLRPLAPPDPFPTIDDAEVDTSDETFFTGIRSLGAGRGELVALLLEQYPILKHFSLMQYYDASKIFKYQGIYWPDIAILLVVSAVMFGVSIVTFRRKEIYV